MNIPNVIASGAVTLLLIACGILFSFGKGAFLIAGYNTMKKVDKEKYHETALCKFMGKVVFVLSFSVFLWGLSEILAVSWIFYAGLILFFAAILFALVYANTFNRFKKQ